MIGPLDRIDLWKVWALDADGDELTTPLLVANHEYTTAAADTPAGTELAGMNTAEVDLWELAYGHPSDMLEVGGDVEEKFGGGIRVPNTYVKFDESRLLDNYSDHSFADIRVELWCAEPVVSSGRHVWPALSTFTQVLTARASGALNDEALALQLYSKSVELLDNNPINPRPLKGFSQFVLFRDSADLWTRPNDASLNGTGSTTLKISFLLDTTAPTADITCYAGPLREMKITTGRVLQWRVKQATGGLWSADQTQATLVPPTNGQQYTLTLRYDGTTMTGQLDGDTAGQVTFNPTGGLATTTKAMTVRGDTTNPIFGVSEVVLWDRELTDAEVDTRHDRGTNPANESDLLVALLCNEADGRYVHDHASGVGAKIEGYPSYGVTPAGPWFYSMEGDVSLAGSRPDTNIGAPCAVPAWPLDPRLGILTCGRTLDYGDFIIGTGQVRFGSLLADGARASAGKTYNSGTITTTVDVNTVVLAAANAGSLSVESDWVPGQKVTISGSGVGGFTELTVKRLLRSYRGTPTGDSGVGFVCEEAVSTDTQTETATAKAEYVVTAGVIGTATGLYPGLVGIIQGNLEVTGRLAILTKEAYDDGWTPFEDALENNGPQLGASDWKKSSTTPPDMAWHARGDSPTRETLRMLCKSGGSASGLPIAAHVDAAGEIEMLEISWPGPTKTISEAEVGSITRLRPSGRRPTAISILSCKNFAQITDGNIAAAALDDPDLVAYMQSPGLYSSPPDDRTVYETALIKGPDAIDLQADLERLQGVEIFQVELKGPLPLADWIDWLIGNTAEATDSRQAEFTSGLDCAVIAVRRHGRKITLDVMAEP